MTTPRKGLVFCITFARTGYGSVRSADVGQAADVRLPARPPYVNQTAEGETGWSLDRSDRVASDDLSHVTSEPQDRQRYGPGAVGPIVQSRACLYELTPDRDFLLGPLPNAPRIGVALGAGHAAKFGALIGTILRDLVLDGRTQHPIQAFRLDRPALAADRCS